MDSTLIYVSAADLAALTGISEGHLSETKYLSQSERRIYHNWLVANSRDVAEWTGVAPSHTLRAIHLRNTPSEADFINNVRAQDLERWKEVKKRLKRLHKLLSEVDNMLTESILRSEDNDLFSQALLNFSPDGEYLGDWINGLSGLREVAARASTYNGASGSEPLPDWVPVLAGYLKVHGYHFDNYQAMMWAFGFRNNDGTDHWNIAPRNPGAADWENPEMLMPRMRNWLKYMRRNADH